MTESSAQQGGIVLTKLSKSYGPVRAFRSIDLMIAPGETVRAARPERRWQNHDHRHGARPDEAGLRQRLAVRHDVGASGRRWRLGAMLQTGVEDQNDPERSGPVALPAACTHPAGPSAP
jgi:hypothetical protein